MYKSVKAKKESAFTYQLHPISIFFFNISFDWFGYLSFLFVNLSFFISLDIGRCLFEGNIKFFFKFRIKILFVLSCKICPMSGHNDVFLSFFPFTLFKLTGRQVSNSLYLEIFKHPLQFCSICLCFSLMFKFVHVSWENVSKTSCFRMTFVYLVSQSI